MTPFGIPSTPGSQDWLDQFFPGPPPALTSNAYAKDYNEVKTVGSLDSTARPSDRADVARFFATSSPSSVFNSIARQVAFAQGRSLPRTRGPWHWSTWRATTPSSCRSRRSISTGSGDPRRRFVDGEVDGNMKTDPDLGFLPFIVTPCFPSYPSNHASGSNSAAEILRRIYGAGGHVITLENPELPEVSLHYTTFKQITDDIDDARVYGGIHFRFDQDAGGRLGRDIATFIYKNNLRSQNDLE